MDRKKRAAIFKAKSDESFEAANLCFQKSLFRATCNRAWYATMQIISAGAYHELDERPAKENFTFSHASQVSLFNRLMESSNRRDYIYLLPYIRDALNCRTMADYEQDQRIDFPTGKKALSTAREVRTAVYQIVGPDWQ